MSEKLIAIKGFRMPQTCIECVMQFGGWCGVSPPEIDERVAETVDEAVRQKKPKWCPLVEIEIETVKKPEVRHGRWAKAADKQYCTECRAVTKVRNAPFCWHCGAKIDLRTPTEVALDIADSVMMGGAENG